MKVKIEKLMFLAAATVAAGLATGCVYDRVRYADGRPATQVSVRDSLSYA